MLPKKYSVREINNFPKRYRSGSSKHLQKEELYIVFFYLFYIRTIVWVYV